MSHPRDLKIAKQLKHCIASFFHHHTELQEIVIDNVIMSDRKHAQILYRINHQTQQDVSAITEIHDKIETWIPRTKKYIADQLNLKAIPNLNFCIVFEDGE